MTPCMALVGHNDLVVIQNAASALRGLRSGGLDAVLGLRECVWLDAKGKPYKLGHPAQDAELCKDTTALANARGGLLLIGYETDRRGGREVLARLMPVPGDSVNLEQYRMILRARVYPDIRDLEIEWIPAGDESGILVIHVPRQRETDKLFVMRGRTPAEGIRVPVRDDDGTRWLETEGVQRLISGGWNALDRGSILSLLETAHRQPVAPPEPVIAVGQGVPGYKAAFEDAYRRIGGKTVLGSPIDEVTDYGPGAAQYFKGGRRGEPAVLCAMPGRSAIAVATPIWEALAQMGAAPGRGGGLAAIGFPIFTTPDDQGGQIALVPASSTEVSVDGGSWGAGRLTRPDRHALWSWEPVERTDFNIWHSNRWTAQEPTDLQIRVTASLPWMTAQPLKISIPGRQRLVEALRRSELSRWVEALLRRKGVQPPTTEWEWATGQGTWQSDRSAHCRMTVPGPGSDPILIAEVMTQLPDDRHLTAVLGVAELRMNFQPWAAELAAAGTSSAKPEALRLTVDELADFYTVAWPTATLLAPLPAVESPATMSPAGPPRVEFEFKVSPYHGSTSSSLQLSEVIDLSAFGPPTSDSYRNQGGFGITAPLKISHAQRRALIDEQLVGLAQSWGFIYASPEALKAAEREGRRSN